MSPEEKAAFPERSNDMLGQPAEQTQEPLVSATHCLVTILRACVVPGPVGIPGVNLRSAPPLPLVRICPNPAFITVFALLSSLMLSSFSHKVGVYMHVCVFALAGTVMVPIPSLSTWIEWEHTLRGSKDRHVTV